MTEYYTWQCANLDIKSKDILKSFVESIRAIKDLIIYLKFIGKKLVLVQIILSANEHKMSAIDQLDSSYFHAIYC